MPIIVRISARSGHYFARENNDEAVSSPLRDFVDRFIVNKAEEGSQSPNTRRALNALTRKRLSLFLSPLGYQVSFDPLGYFTVRDHLGFFLVKAKKLKYLLYSLNYLDQYRSWWEQSSPQERNQEEPLERKVNRLGLALQNHSSDWHVLHHHSTYILRTRGLTNIERLVNSIIGQVLTPQSITERLSQLSLDPVAFFFRSRNKRLTPSEGGYSLFGQGGHIHCWANTLKTLLLSEGLVPCYFQWEEDRQPRLTLEQEFFNRKE